MRGLRDWASWGIRKIGLSGLITRGRKFSDVAQIFNLPYRRFAIGWVPRLPWVQVFSTPAEYNSAIQSRRRGKNLRYDTSSNLRLRAVSSRDANPPISGPLRVMR